MSEARASLSVQRMGAGVAIDTLGFDGKELCEVLQSARMHDCSEPVQTVMILAVGKQEALG